MVKQRIDSQSHVYQNVYNVVEKSYIVKHFINFNQFWHTSFQIEYIFE